ncbi:MAG TPA: xyloglucanase, partial [Cellvibrio sp.]|nr:xyloglucanase [Cellvibrio sp.]
FWVKGIEETVPLDAVSIPNGPFVSAIGDYDGFVHTDVTQYSPIHTPRLGATTGLAVAAQDTNQVVRLGPVLYYSTDMANSWTLATLPAVDSYYGKVALTADGRTLVYSSERSATSYYSTDSGFSWTAISGLAVTRAQIVADTVNKNKLYALDGGTMMVSTNGGVSFSAAGTLSNSSGAKLIRTAPGVEGDIWVALNEGGLARSTNSGVSFAAISGVTYAGAVGFGKTAEGKNFPTAYIWGTVKGVKGIFRSIDEGASWVRVNDDAHQYGGPGNGKFILGDMNTFGTVYMSTAGRGIVYGKISSTDSSSASSTSSASSVPTSSSSISSSSITSTSSSVASSSAASSSAVSSSVPASGSSSGGSKGGGSMGIWELLCLGALFCALRTRRLASNNEKCFV